MNIPSLEKSQSNPKQEVSLVALLAIYCVSAGATLASEVLWQRILTRSLGSTTQSTMIVLAVFMLGAALGTLAFSFRPMERAKAFRWFSDCQFCLAALVIATSMPLLDEINSPLVYLLIGSMASGASFPLLNIAAYRQSDSKNLRASLLYSAGLIGALGGTALSGFILLPMLGFRQLARLVGMVFIVSGLVSIFLAGKVTSISKGTEEATLAGDNKLDWRLPILTPVIGIMVTAAILSSWLQLLLTRLSANLYGSSTFSFSAVSCCVLLGLSVGALCATGWLGRSKDSFAWLKVVLAVQALLLAFFLFELPQLPWIYYKTACIFASDTSWNFVLPRLLVIALAVVPFFCVAGAVYPCLLSHLYSQQADLTKRASVFQASVLSASALIGSLVGFLISGLSLFPILASVDNCGVELNFVCLCAAYSFLVLVLQLPGRRPDVHKADVHQVHHNKKLFWLATGTLLSTLILVFQAPYWGDRIFSSGIAYWPLKASLKRSDFDRLVNRGVIDDSLPKDETLFYRDGRDAAVSVTKSTRLNALFLKVNGKVEGSLPISDSSESSKSAGASTTDKPTEVLLAELPALYTGKPVKRAFVIGLGTGTTSGALLKLPQMENVQVAEIEPMVALALHELGQSGEAIHDKRLHLVNEEGRRILKESSEKFDLIISQPSEPWLSQSCALFTREFFAIARQHLSNDGVYCQWLQLYAIESEELLSVLKTFQTEFPNCLVYHPKDSGELLLIGFPAHARQIAAERLNQAGYSDNLADAHVQSLKNLTDGVILDGPGLARIIQSKGAASPLVTDDNSLLEFSMPSHGLSGDALIDSNLKFLLQ